MSCLTFCLFLGFGPASNEHIRPRQSFLTYAYKQNILQFEFMFDISETANVRILFFISANIQMQMKNTCMMQ
jgi:hypothetical protein